MKRSFQYNMPKVETFDRDLVLKQAIHVFRKKGYNAASMQDLVDATDLNRSSIYNSFKNKKNLYLECLTFYEAKYNREIAKRLIQSITGLEAIEQIFKLYLFEMLKNKEELGCLIVNSKSEMANQDELITHFLNSNQQRTLELLSDLITQGQNDNTINKNQSPEEYALYVYSSLQGFRMTGILVSDKGQLQSIITTVLQVLI